jgi:hypothetical protein
VSAAGSVMDALAAHARVALGLGVGDPRVERGVRDWRSLQTDTEMPHGFVHQLDRPWQTGPHRQRSYVADTTVSLIADATQEAMLVISEAFAARIAADPTIGGLVQNAWVERDSLSEGMDERRIVNVVVAWKVEA